MKHSTRISVWILITILLIGAIGCDSLVPPATQAPAAEQIVTMQPTAAPTPEPAAEEIVLATPEATEIPTLPPTPTPTPTPEPTEVPTPSPIPFSYYCPTVNMSFEELVGSLPDFDESKPKSNDSFWMPKGYPKPDTYRILVDLYWQLVIVYTKDPETGEYTVPVRYMTCASGNPRKYAETQAGTFQMKPTKVRFGNFKTGETAQYWSLIRSRTYFHSTIYSKYRDLSSVDKASYEAVITGTKASHACIRLLVPDARWIFYNISYDTVCEIRKGSKDDAEMKAIRDQMHFAPWKDNADLSTANTPYTDNWTIEAVPTDMPYVHATQPPVPKS
ncbi:MAG: L,D-transpeptidase [Clostridia bacterium]|nr:L,D-transpeptidase [Clostridia bacterium]